MPYNNTLENYSLLVNEFHNNNPKAYFIMPDKAIPTENNRDLFYFKIVWNDENIIINGNKELFTKLLQIFHTHLERPTPNTRQFHHGKVVFDLNTNEVYKKFEQVRLVLTEDYYSKINAANDTVNNKKTLFQLYYNYKIKF